SLTTIFSTSAFFRPSNFGTVPMIEPCHLSFLSFSNLIRAMGRPLVSSTVGRVSFQVPAGAGVTSSWAYRTPAAASSTASIPILARVMVCFLLDQGGGGRRTGRVDWSRPDVSLQMPRRRNTLAVTVATTRGHDDRETLPDPGGPRRRRCGRSMGDDGES